MDLVFTVGGYDLLAMASAQFRRRNRRRSRRNGNALLQIVNLAIIWLMPKFTKPAEGSWTEHYPELGTAPVSYEDSISPEHYEKERDAIFRKHVAERRARRATPQDGQLLHP